MIDDSVIKKLLELMDKPEDWSYFIEKIDKNKEEQIEGVKHNFCGMKITLSPHFEIKYNMFYPELDSKQKPIIQRETNSLITEVKKLKQEKNNKGFTETFNQWYDNKE